MPSKNSKRIAKNTLFLYFRMLLIMAVSLFTVRIVFNTLGVVDYGIYNVVAGIVMMFSFLSNTMASASQRFFAFEIGRNDILQLKRTFSLTIVIYVIIALVVILLAETIGLWLLNTKLTIPVERMEAANWVYQFTILSFLATIIRIPYNAAIIAHEDMNLYAYVSIVEAFLKLLIVYMLMGFPFDKLKVYGCLMFTTVCIITLIYMVICKQKYKECCFRFYWETSLFNTLVSYSSWNLFGAIAAILNKQGVNILLNIYFSPVVNAARAVAYQLSAAVNQFATNFHHAVGPQIIKYYASEERNQMLHLVFQSSKFSYYLLFLLSMPVLLETHYLLTWWLKETPEYTVLFTRLVVITALIDSLSYPLMTAAQATGKIKLYQAVVGGTLLLNLPISYCFLKLGYPPQVTMYVTIGISIICLLLRLLMLNALVGLRIYDYFRKVFVSICFVSMIAYIVPLYTMFQFNENFQRFMIVGVSGFVTSFVAILAFGLSINERKVIIRFIKKRIVNIAKG